LERRSVEESRRGEGACEVKIAFAIPCLKEYLVRKGEVGERIVV